jgi:endonuclease/exonuclease/phosphatase (EEP) superfamily protein YafD
MNMTDIAAETTLQRRRPARNGWSTLLWLLTAALLLCQATIWYGPESPKLAVLDQLAIQLASLALCAALLAAALRRWIRLALLVALTATLSWPIFSDRGEASVVTDPARLKILSANVWQLAEGHERTVETLMASDADIIGLVEVTPNWRTALAPLIAKYPYHVDCRESGPKCQILLLSKLPIEKLFAGRIWRATPIVASAELMWNGRPFTVVVTHLFRPLAPSDESKYGEDDPAFSAYLAQPLPLSRQAGQAGLFAKYLNRQPDDLILMGDFNSTPWSRVQRAFRERTHLDSQAGWVSSWPSFLPWPLRVPIDHVLARGHLVVTQFSAGPETDSDHLPVIAEIGWKN